MAFQIIGYVILIVEILLCVSFVNMIINSIKHNGVISKLKLLYSFLSFIVFYAIAMIALVYGCETFSFKFLFSAFSNAVKFFAFGVPFETTSQILTDYPIYNVIGYTTFALVLITEVFGFIILFGSYIKNYFSVNKKIKNNADIVIGDSPDSEFYVSNNKNSVLWVAGLDNDNFIKKMKKGFSVLTSPFNSKTITKKFGNGEHHLIVFKDTNYNVAKLISVFESAKANNDSLLYLHLEAVADEMKVIRKKYVSEVTEKSNSFITSFSRHELIARNFLLNYPITKYVPRDFFNEDFTLKEDKDINIVFLGFGKINRELFRIISTEFQFATMANGKLKCKPVNYYIYDRDEENLNNEYLSKLQEMDSIFEDTSLPLPEDICAVKEIKKIDVKSVEARHKFRSVVGENSYSYFIVSLAGDMWDASFAQDLKYILGRSKNYKIFVRAKDGASGLIERKEKRVVYFGEAESCINHANIVNDELMSFSKKINGRYNKLSDKKIDNIRSWESLPLIEQYSNISSALSIPFKINLLGFDFALSNTENKKTVSKEEFDKVFNEVEDAKLNEFDFYFQKSPINTLAYIEHLRWNAFYIFNDFRPLPFNEFMFKEKVVGKDENGCDIVKKVLLHKDVKASKHACLTTYEGLKLLIDKEFEMIEAECKKDGEGTLKIDKTSLYSIYGYDYMVLNKLYENIVQSGFFILEK